MQEIATNKELSNERLLKNREKQVGAMLSYLQLILSIVFSLFILPIVLEKIGKSEYGILTFSASMVNYLTLITMGTTSAYIRFNMKYRVANDKYGEEKLNGTFMKIYLFLGFVIFIFGIVLTVIVHFVFSTRFTPIELQKTELVMIISIFDMAISLPLSLYQMIINAREKFIFLKIISLLKAVLHPLIRLPIVLLGGASVEITLGLAFLNISLGLVQMLYVVLKLKTKFIYGKPLSGVLKSLFSFGFFVLLIQIIDLINWNIDNVILGYMLGTDSVAVYSVATQFSGYFSSFICIIATLYIPEVNRNQAEIGDLGYSQKNFDLMLRVGKMQGTIAMLLLLGIIAFGRQFLYYWLGEGYEQSYLTAILLISPLFLTSLINLGIEIRRAKNMHKIPSIVMFFSALLNIAITIPLINVMGVPGAALGTFCSIVANFIFTIYYYHFKVKLNMIVFFKGIARLSVGWIIPIIITVLLLFVQMNLWQMILLILAFAIVYVASMFIFGVTKEERIQIIAFVKKVFNKLIRTLRRAK